MSFHESAWLLIGGAAPVIALANLLTLQDSWGRSFAGRLPRYRAFLASDTSARPLPPVAAHQPDELNGDEILLHMGRKALPSIAYYMSALIAIAQAVLLGLAIASLTAGADAVSPMIAAVLEPLSIYLMMHGAVLMGMSGTIMNHIKPGADERTADTADRSTTTAPIAPPSG